MQVYRDYAAEVHQLVERINRRFGREGWQPVQVISGQNRARAIAGLCNYDVLLVNPLADGMNLVAKEGPVLNQRDGVLMLSRTAGAYGELGGHALGIDPCNLSDTAAALVRAVQMSDSERKRRAGALRSRIAVHQLDDWFRALRKDLAITDYLKQRAYNPRIA
jgi:trehalose 6-phosphate synthase